MEEFEHQVIDHAVEYVNGKIHTNGMENFWSLLKRSLNGTYVSVEPFHLFRYVDEQAFRYNNRQETNDSQRFDLVVSQIFGKRRQSFLCNREAVRKRGVVESVA